MGSSRALPLSLSTVTTLLALQPFLFLLSLPTGASAGLVGGLVGGLTQDALCLLDPCQCQSNWHQGFCEEETIAESYGDDNMGNQAPGARRRLLEYNDTDSCHPKSIPKQCNLPQNCSCQVVRRTGSGDEVNGDFHVRGMWELTYPIATSYGLLSSAVNWVLGGKPVLFSSQASRAQCCQACHDINANANFNAGVNLAANASLLGQLNISANASVDVNLALSAKLASCNYWHHIPVPGLLCQVLGSNLYDTVQSLLDLDDTPAGGCGYCLIYPPGVGPTCSSLTCPANSPACPDSQAGRGGNFSSVGKGCAHGVNDPHFVGAQGTHFDFNGAPGESFCLVTDSQFHINMGMTGYYDTRTVGASKLKDGLAVRTWIRDLGVMWVDQATGDKHSLLLTARTGKHMERAGGYMGSILVNGVRQPLLELGESRELPGGGTLSFKAYEKQGGGFFDVDAYELRVAGLMTLEIKLRPAHPLLQTPTDAMTHINLRILHMKTSSTVHGVLGQTYRQGRERRAIEYTMLSHLLHRSFSADGEGVGFLDGSASDYKTSSVGKADCKYSSFGI